MTIFDSIRYPVPDTVTRWDHMPPLPKEIVLEFERQREEAVASNALDRNDSLGLVRLLRKVILEHDDDNI